MTMVDVAALIVFVVCILAFLGVLFWYGLKGESNQDPAIGTNRPYPDGVGPTGPGSDTPPYLADFTVSEAETFRRNAGKRLTRPFRRPLKARSWMDEPGALEAAGLESLRRQGHPASSPRLCSRRALRRRSGAFAH